MTGTGELLSIATSGLNAYQKAIATTGHNITNVDTPNYSRQVTDLSTRAPGGSGTMFTGSGVTVTSVRRVADSFIESQRRTQVSSFERLEAFHTNASHLDAFLSQTDSSLPTGLNEFFSSLQDVAADPANVGAREAFLSQGGAIATYFNNINTELTNQNDATRESIRAVVTEINQLGTNIASINQQIVTKNSSADLQDQRDKMLHDLSQLISVSTFEQTDGAMNVFIGSGQNLVVGGTSSTLVTTPNQFDSQQLDIAFNVSGSLQRIDSNTLEGGQLQGLLQLRDTLIKPSLNQVGRIAIAFANNMNTTHQKGMDLNGNLGGLMFNDINSTSAKQNRVIEHSSNTGTATLEVTISDPSAMTDIDYRLDVSNTGIYSLTNLTSNAVTTFSSFPTTVDGVSIAIASGSVAASDSFLIKPSRYAARDLSLSLTSSSSLALATPVRTNTGERNTGTGVISDGSLTDVTNASFTTSSGALSPPLRVDFLSPTTYRILNDTTGAVVSAGPYSYDPAAQNTLFPTDAVHVGTAGTQSTAGSLDTIASGELIINGVTITASTSDGVSTSDASGSALAIASAINADTDNHGVTATVAATSLNLGAYTVGTLSGSEFQINGENIVVSTATQAEMLTQINLLSGTTGVSAAANSSNEIVLTAADGRNIQITTAGGATTTSFANFTLTGAADDDVQRAAVTLTRPSGDLIVAGTDPADAGFTANTYSRYDPGYTAVLSGSPSTGDTFSFNYNTSGQNDSRNALSLLEFQTTKTLDSGRSSYLESYSALVVSVGSTTHQAELDKSTSKSLVDQLDKRREEISGVNLDEEAANLMAYKQIYEAVARLIRVSDEMMNSIFSAIG